MKSELISLFIDDELDLDEKLSFVETVHAEAVFKDETIELLKQEKLLCLDGVDRVPEVHFKKKQPRRFPRLRPLFPWAAALTALLLFLVYSKPVPENSSPVPAKAGVPYRFVIYQPEATRVEIAGSFSDWRAIPLNKAGSQGYWETIQEVPPGEYRLCYIIGGDRRIPDPTIPAREKDDFGGENSVLEVVNKS
ncbi:MAG: glycogen-binding domain-containing protein [Desulfobacterales bacterium]